MSALRRKKGNIVIALLMLVVSLAYVFFVASTSMYKLVGDATPTSLVDGALGIKGFITGDFKYNFNAIKEFKIENINYLATICLAGPLVGSILALIFRRYRFFNLINFLLVFVSLFSFWYLAINTQLFKEYFDSLSTYGLVAHGCLVGHLFLAFINLELCR